jgi:uncharacterized protein
VYIQANIHGPEIAGIGAAHVLIDRLKQEPSIYGQITIVPSINPVGLDSKINGMQVGYADLNETVVGNFNRVYQLLTTNEPSNDPEDVQKVALDAFVKQHLASDIPTIRQAFNAALVTALADLKAKRSLFGSPRFGMKLAITIQELAQTADYCIDLHTAGRAAYHVFTFEEMFGALPYFGIHNVIQLADDFSGVFDEAMVLPWLRLCKAFAKHGREIAYSDFEREAFTLELGSADRIYRKNMEEDAERIINYLRHKGILEGEGQIDNTAYNISHQRDYNRYNAPIGGLILWQVTPGQYVRSGDTLATILCAYNREAGPTEVPIRAVEDGIALNLVESQVVHEGMALCSVMSRLRSYQP